jgi:hypothetical protein
MRVLIIIFLLFSFKFYSQQNANSESSFDKFMKENIERLHETINKSVYKNRLMSDRLLITETGRLLENKYFDTITTKKIKKAFPAQNLLYGNNIFPKVLKLLKVKGLQFLKLTTENTKDRTFVFINKFNYSYSEKEGIIIIKKAPVAFYAYKYDFEKKEKVLIEEDIYILD